MANAIRSTRQAATAAPYDTAEFVLPEEIWAFYKGAGLLEYPVSESDNFDGTFTVTLNGIDAGKMLVETDAIRYREAFWLDVPEGLERQAGETFEMLMANGVSDAHVLMYQDDVERRFPRKPE